MTMNISPANVRAAGTPSRTRSHQFLDKSLTALESLVLECQLEDAHQQQQTGRMNLKECEMSAADYGVIARLPGNERCADCDCMDAEWASVTFGILLCADCSGVHRSLGTHISRVRSIKMDGWSKDHLDAMRLGGNRACRVHLQRHGVDLDQEAKDKYASEPATAYKQLLQDKILRKQGRLDETESSTEVGSVTSTNRPPARVSTATTTTMDESCASFASEPDLAEDSSSSRKAPPPTLDAWFGKRRKPPALRSSTGNASVQSSSQSSRASYRRSHSSNSAPTITYLGRSFSASGSDDSRMLRKINQAQTNDNGQPLAHLAAQQEEIVRENRSSSTWRMSAPANFWSADKKVEPFQSSSDTGAAASTRQGGCRTRRQHRETMRQQLAYTDADILQIAMDDQEFARLKAGLKQKGAVTNEVLKQKLYAFVAKSKIRRSSTMEPQHNSIVQDDDDDVEEEGSSRTAPKRGMLQASKSEDLSSLRAKIFPVA